MFMLAAVLMAIDRLADIFDFYRFGLGALAYCVNQIRSRLDQLGFERGVQVADEVKRVLDEALEKKLAWKQQKRDRPIRQQGTQQIDDEIDQTLNNFVKALEAFTHMPDDSDQCQCADEIIDEMFPEGVYPITSETFNTQHALVDKIVAQLRDRYADELDDLSLTEMVDKLDRLNTEFERLLEPEGPGVTYDEVQSAHTEAEDAFHRLVAVVVGEYADDMETLNQVMYPVIEQTERTRRHLKRTGTVPEVDPESGEPVDPDDQAPTDGGSPDGDSPTDEEAPEDEVDSSGDGGSDQTTSGEQDGRS
jgi:hypothetical protein